MIQTQQDFINLNSLQENKLFVFTSLRRIRDFANTYDGFIPKTVSIGEFLERAVFVKDRVRPSDAELLLSMRQACEMTKGANEALKIPSEFFAFLKNNNYLFSFFKEVAWQKKSIDDLKFNDIYANYEEHIEILDSVLQNYKNILAQNGFYDEISICELYEINESYVKSYNEIEIEIWGILSEFEWEILLKCATLTKLNIVFNSLKLNLDLIQKIAQISQKDISEFKENHKFRLSLNDFVLTNLGQNPQNRLVLSRGFKLRSMQAAYVFEKISTFIKDGLEAKDIVVILPDESFANTLRLYDEQKMLSFAMGKPFSQSLFYTVFSLILKSLKEKKNLKLGDEILKQKSLSSDEFFLTLVGLSQDFYENFRANYENFLGFDDFSALILDFATIFGDKNVLEILNSELFFMKYLLSQNKLKLYQACELLLVRLAQNSIDDVGGGAVRVMGLLESRGLSFDGVIIVDFNDDLVPKRVVNEMFLSSKVRQKAGLISYTQRENLQRSYYKNLISSAKKVAISHSLDEGKIASRFLSEFDVVVDTFYGDDDYLGLFVDGGRAKFKAQNDFLKHNFFDKELSFSRLSVFLSCPRKYYYYYVLGLKEPRMLDKPANSEFGTKIHEALFEYYSNYDRFSLFGFLEILNTKSLNPLELEMCAIKFKKFEEFETKRNNEGWFCDRNLLEKELKICFDGVWLGGKIDRIDRHKDGSLCVIDYKTGSSYDPLQLEFYKILADTDEAYFYDLKDSMEFVVAKEPKFSIGEILNDIKEYFKSPSYEPKPSADCTYCPFVAICKGQI